jgi:hypothetical protein
VVLAVSQVEMHVAVGKLASPAAAQAVSRLQPAVQKAATPLAPAGEPPSTEAAPSGEAPSTGEPSLAPLDPPELLEPEPDPEPPELPEPPEELAPLVASEEPVASCIEPPLLLDWPPVPSLPPLLEQPLTRIRRRVAGRIRSMGMPASSTVCATGAHCRYAREIKRDAELARSSGRANVAHIV